MQIEVDDPSHSNTYVNPTNMRWESEVIEAARNRNYSYYVFNGQVYFITGRGGINTDIIYSNGTFARKL